MTLRLEYICSEAEQKEAKTLQERQVYGGGSKWRTNLVLFGLLALTLAGAYAQFKMEMTAKERPWFILLAIVIFIGFMIYKRFVRKKKEFSVQLDVSERELVFRSDNGRSTMQWSGFSQCLESSAVFVLVDRTKSVLFPIPKRAFPDAASQDWFRTQATQFQNSPAVASQETFVPGRFVTSNGIARTIKLGYWDYFNRSITSWRMRGMFLAIIAFMVGVVVFTPAPPHAVNSPEKTLLIMLPIFTVMMGFVIAVLSFISWRAEKKCLDPQHIVINEEGVEFAGRDITGRLPWHTYKYYLENRWCFFLWHPQTSLWVMLPKRDFAAPSELSQFRNLIQTKLQPSRWFWL